METNRPDNTTGSNQTDSGRQDKVPYGEAFGAASDEFWGRNSEQQTQSEESWPADAPERTPDQSQVPEIPAHATAGSHQLEAQPDQTTEPEVDKEGWQHFRPGGRMQSPGYPVIGIDRGSRAAESYSQPEDTARTVRLPGRLALGQTTKQNPSEGRHE